MQSANSNADQPLANYSKEAIYWYEAVEEAIALSLLVCHRRPSRSALFVGSTSSDGKKAKRIDRQVVPAYFCVAPLVPQTATAATMKSKASTFRGRFLGQVPSVTINTAPLSPNSIQRCLTSITYCPHDSQIQTTRRPQSPNFARTQEAPRRLRHPNRSTRYRLPTSVR